MTFANERRQEQRFVLSSNTVTLALMTSSADTYEGEPLQFVDYSRSGFSFLSPYSFHVGARLSVQLSENLTAPVVLDVLICNREKIDTYFRYGVFSEARECDVVASLA
jgi:hypothetical protein